jgi:DNA-binding XRE family transcriptional regulator
VKTYLTPRAAVLEKLPEGLVRRRPRSFAEWKALRQWAQLPKWEPEPAGYLLRLCREKAGLSQLRLAKLLGCSQQAVAQAERWQSNPTVEFMRSWARACRSRIKLEIR